MTSVQLPERAWIINKLRICMQMNIFMNVVWKMEKIENHGLTNDSPKFDYKLQNYCRAEFCSVRETNHRMV